MIKYKILLISLILIVISFSSYSQENESKNYNLVSNVTTVGLGSSNILDPYLSPFEYNGTHLEFLTENRRYASLSDTILSLNNRLSVILGQAKHPAGLNTMMFFNGNYDLGFYRHYRPLTNLNCMLGGSWDVDLGGKYIARNVNNPFSLDLYTDVNFAFSANYTFKLKVFNWFTQNFRVEYGAKTPLAGCMFVPPQGASYYEIFSLGNFNDSFHFTSIHNKRAISQYFNLDIPLKFTTLRVGIKNDLMQYKANDIVYHNYNYTVNVGCVVDLYVFNGTKNTTSKNFRRAY